MELNDVLQIPQEYSALNRLESGLEGLVVASITGICIKCCACLKRCPVGAKYFDDANYLWHARELEVKFTDTRREPECFV